MTSRNEGASGANEANSDGNTTLQWMEMIFGVVIGVVVLAVAVLVVFMAKQKREGKGEDMEMSSVAAMAKDKGSPQAVIVEATVEETK